MEPHDVGGNLTDSAMENIAENSNFASTNVIEAAESEKVSALENALEKAASQDITSGNTQISSNLTEALLIEMRDLSKKRLFFQKIATGCMAGLLLVVFLTCIIVVPKAMTTLSHINNVSVKAENSLDEIDVMTKGITSATDSLNELVAGNSASLTEAVTSLSRIDFDGLNKAITDLQDAAGPMAALMKRFR
ncbi:hypothetical protein [Butyrivibrio sp. M55]|uniref:hypothetical protein n=1 Tax=Butyrivibrio sp. M55 TaxID=1855323 RepID=UPI0008F0E377|nr:hypothetical protein [Butyrivibrio sp. M55]SFU83139.1 hypothetical protein SAMN05216540_11279 [Butyrivibrio sp. M55]